MEKKVRLPTSAEWEYAARVGTSSPPFAEKYKDQNSSGPSGYKFPLKVKSKKANAWGLYDMASCWWEITGDKAMYHVRKSVVDPHYPPGVETARSQRTGRGIVSDRWSIGTHEFITEKADYAGQKFRVVVEIEATDPKKPALPLFDGLGKHSRKIETNSATAQRYFDQGLMFMFAYNHDEAVRAFRQAANLDPESAMPYWGIALASGMNYN